MLIFRQTGNTGNDITHELINKTKLTNNKRSIYLNKRKDKQMHVTFTYRCEI